MLAILDYKAGNQTSVRRALDYVGIPGVITADPQEALHSEGIIFPGVGAAGQAMRQLQQSGLDNVLRQAVAKGHPVLGICLGCQIMLDMSEENATKTLGLISGTCRHFDPSWTEAVEEPNAPPRPIRIPHMGWNTLQVQKNSPLLTNVPSDAAFYFVHSYYVDTAQENVIATTHHGQDICAIYGRDGLWATQFHPEKSGRPGLTLLENFYRFCKTNTHETE